MIIDEMIAIYRRHHTYCSSLEKLAIRSRHRCGLLHTGWFLRFVVSSNFDKLRFKFSVVAPHSTIFSDNSACCMGHTHNFHYIYGEKTPATEKSASRCSVCFINSLEWDETYKKPIIMWYRNSSLSLFGLWNPLAMILVKNDWNLRRKSIIIVISYFVILSLQIMLLDLFSLVIVQKW